MMLVLRLFLCAWLFSACAASEPKPDAKTPPQSDEIEQPKYSADELIQVAQAYNASGESKKALGVLEKALAEKPSDPEGLYQKGLALSRLERRPEAIVALEQAHQLAPRHLPTARLLGMAYDLERKGELAAKVYQAALAAHPANPELLHEYGLSLLMQGKIPQGLAALVQALQGKPQDAGLLGDLGYAYMLNGKPKQARKHLQASLDRQADQPEVVFNLGRACLASADEAAALSAFKKLVTLLPKNPNTHFQLGLVLHKLGKKAEAQSAMETARTLDPKHAGAGRWLKKHAK